MRSRRLILGLIILVLLVTCLAAAVKLRATPKYDRVQVGEAFPLEPPFNQLLYFQTVDAPGAPRVYVFVYDWDEGRVEVKCNSGPDLLIVADKHITRRGPLERLAWGVGWRPQPDPIEPGATIVVTPPPKAPPPSNTSPKKS